MPPSEGFVETNSLSAEGRSLRLHYLEWGDAGPPAVLLHATGFLARLWEPVAEGLSGRFHVYAYDARGHGDSDKPALSPVEGPALSPVEGPDSAYTWDHFAADFRGFLDALELRRVLAIGHSMGGATAAHLAATEPEYVSATVLIEPIIAPRVANDRGERRRHELISGAARRRMVWPSREALVRSYRKRPTFANWRDDVLHLYAEHGTFLRDDGRFELKCPGRIEARTFQNSLSLDTWGVLPGIRCPTLVLHGQHTEWYLALAARAVAEHIPGARLAVIAGAGHLVPMERPGTVLAEIMAFLGQGAGAK
jgi:lipase